MKKILSTIAVFGLVATTGTTVISCSENITDKKGFFELNTYEIHLPKNGGNVQGETIEILDFDKRMEDFDQQLSPILWQNGYTKAETQTLVEVEHVSGITNIKIDRNQNLIKIEANDTRGKSRWVINLYTRLREKPSEILFKVKPVYFDVFID